MTLRTALSIAGLLLAAVGATSARADTDRPWSGPAATAIGDAPGERWLPAHDARPAARLTGAPSAATVPNMEASPRQFRLVAQTPRATVWAERCIPAPRTRGASPVHLAAAARALPQPDPEDLSALVAALRSGDFEASGVRVVETGDGPMLELAARRPGAGTTYFMICNAAIRTSYE